MKNLFKNHLDKAVTKTQEAMKSLGVDCLFIESGFPNYYFLDDQPTPFRANPQFLYFCPDGGPGHILKIEKNNPKPKLFFHIPFDFWHETSNLNGAFWESFFDVDIIGDTHGCWKKIVDKSLKNFIISPSPQAAVESGCTVQTESLLNALNWNRSSKSEYEIECLLRANKIASKGHIAAKEAFFNGKSEFEIFQSYLSASGIRETELPYGNIVALDSNSAVLHYQTPKSISNGKTFLIDAGARYNGYCADITRTYCQESVDSRFKYLIEIVEFQQKEQVQMVQPGMDYVDIHRKAYYGVAEALREIGVLKCDVESAIELKIPFSFFPHGVGHPLGLQVHDVGAKQEDASGKIISQPSEFPYLRTLRKIQLNDVLTIEPGFYFIPMLLNKLKAENKVASESLNWSAIEELIPFGGIRIEDNIVATLTGPKNLTRTFLQ